MRICGVALGILLLAGSLAGEAAAQHQHGGQGQPAASDDFGKGMQASMATMMKDMEAAPMTGEPDKDFLAMMIPHHEGAVEMARLVLLHGRDPMVRKLAEDIIAGQTTEIASMKARLTILRAGRDPNPGGFPALEGTRGPVPAAPPAPR